jgi:lipopolysaccharide heptosyltransferase II
LRPSLTALDAERIAIIKPSALGDIVHALPVASALRRRFPRANLAWVVNRSYQPLLAGHPDLDMVIAFDRRAGVAGFARFAANLRRQRFDLVIDLQGLLRTGLMVAATGAHRRIGLASAREGSRWFYTDVVAATERDAGHAVDRYWRVVEELGAADMPKRFVVPIPAEARQWVAERLVGYPRPWLVIGAGSRWLTKRWPVECFIDLASRFQVHFGGTVIAIGSPDEAELSNAVVAGVPAASVNLAGATNLRQLSAILKSADLVLANDSGPLHLAAALGRPVVAPYLCTQVRLHGPYGASASAVETNVWCRGSYLRKCDRLECMRELTAERLWPVIKAMVRPAA